MKFNMRTFLVLLVVGLGGFAVLKEVIKIVGENNQLAFIPDPKEFKRRSELVSKWLYAHPEGLPKTDPEALAADLCGRSNGVTILLNRRFMGRKTADLATLQDSEHKEIMLIGTQEALDGCSFETGAIPTREPGRHIAVLYADGTGDTRMPRQLNQK